MMRTLALGALIVFFVPILAHGQKLDYVVETVDGKKQYVSLAEMKVTPQKPHVPALKYKLTYAYDQQEKNNAAIAYNFAMRELAYLNYATLSNLTHEAEREREQLFIDPKFFAQKKKEFEEFEKMLAALPEDAAKSAHTLRDEKTMQYQSFDYAYYCDLPLEKFPFDKARKFLRQFGQVYRFIEKGSRCDYCDWEYHIRGNRDLIALPLPEIQECRGLARGLMIKARVEIHDKKYDEAIKTIRVGKKLSQHVGREGSFLVSTMIALSIDANMNACLVELAQQPDAPNLYWTLSDLPYPVFSFSESVRLEVDGIRIMLPEVAKAMDNPEGMSENDWKEFHRVLEKALPYLIDMEPSLSIGEFGTKMLGKFWSVTAYPKAEKWLLAEGKTADQIEKMSVAKVLGLWSIYRYSIVYDNIAKGVQIPYWQWKEYDAPDPIERQPSEVMTPLDAIVCSLSPSYDGARTALLRMDVTADIMRIVEAIRFYAAENDGKLPEKLEDIRQVPIPPLDPLSGKPYSYRIVDGAAFIESNLSYGLLRFKVTLETGNAKPEQDGK